MKNLVSFSCAIADAGSLNTLVPAIAHAGFDGVEPTFTLQNGFPNFNETAASAKQLRQTADSLGLQIPSMRGGPAFWDHFASPDAEIRNRGIELAKRALEALNLLGGSVLLAVPGRWTQEQTHASVWAHAVESAQKIGELAKAANVTLALENVENDYLCSPREWNQFLAEIDHPSVGLYFDVGNVVRNRQGAPDRWIEALAPWIRRVHFKGATRGGVPTELFAGDVDWTTVIPALQNISYTDWIGVELNPPIYCVPQWLKTVRITTREILALA